MWKDFSSDTLWTDRSQFNSKSDTSGNINNRPTHFLSGELKSEIEFLLSLGGSRNKQTNWNVWYLLAAYFHIQELRSNISVNANVAVVVVWGRLSPNVANMFKTNPPYCIVLIHTKC